MELFRYQHDDGSEPFTAWLNSLRDKASQAADATRAKTYWREWKRRQA
jgi:hypothetical protein